MKYKLFNLTATYLAISLILLGLAISVSAQTASTGTSTPSGTKTQAVIARLITTADNQISQRITALNALNSRIQEMLKLSTDEKNKLATSIQDQIVNLTNLKYKIDAETVLTTLRADIQSIAKSYRIYLLVIPQGAIIASGDRVLTITDAMTTVGTKIQTRLSNVPAGTDTSAIQSLLSDYNLKVSDAATQANAAIAEVSGLTPDNGDTTQAQANKAALTDAREKIKTASTDLQAARKDIGAIVKNLKAINKNSNSAGPTGTSANP